MKLSKYIISNVWLCVRMCVCVWYYTSKLFDTTLCPYQTNKIQFDISDLLHLIDSTIFLSVSLSILCCALCTYTYENKN